MRAWTAHFKKLKADRAARNAKQLADILTEYDSSIIVTSPTANTFLLSRGDVSLFYYSASHTWRHQRGNSKAKPVGQMRKFIEKHFPLNVK